MPIVRMHSRLAQALLVLAAVVSLLATPVHATGPMAVSSGLQITSLPVATAGSPYQAALFVGGGTAPYTWTGSGLPTGLSLGSNGILSGTPTVPSGNGLTSFLATVTDSSTTPLTTTATVYIAINPAKSAVTVTSLSLPPATVGKTYSALLSAAGGSAPYTWKLINGSTLPAGLSLNPTGAISGTPTVSTPSNGMMFTVSATDNSSAPQTATANVAIMVDALGAGFRIDPTNLPPATAGSPYNDALVAKGGAAPFTWTASGVPAGLSLSSTGILSGTPTAPSGTPGPSVFSVTVKDSSATPQTATALVNIMIKSTQNGLHIGQSNLPPATAGAAYTTTLAAQGGTAPYTWTASNTPAGLSLSSGGILSGTPTTPSGSSPTSFVVTMTDSSKTPLTATAPVTIVINPAGAALNVTSFNLPPATVGASYSAQLQAAGGTAPYSWKLAKAVTLPAGLSMSATGTIAGTPTAATSASGFTFSVYVLDSSATQQVATANITLFVNPAGPAISISSRNLPPAYLGAKYSVQLTAVGGTAPYTWALAKGAALPAGLSLSASGQLTGTATALPTNSLVQIPVAVTDSSAASNTVSGTVLLNIYPAAPSCTHDGSGNARLKGQYAFAASGFDAFSGSHLNLLGSLTADGAGTLTAAAADSNAPEWESPETPSYTGTYSIGSQDSRGIFNLTDSDGNSIALCFVADQLNLSGVATSGWLMRADESGESLAGTLNLQDSTAFSAASLKGNYTFGLQGQSIDPSGNHLRSALAGYLALDGAGNVTVGEADMSQQRQGNGNAIVNMTETQIPLSGIYTVASSGRGALALKLPGGGTANFAFQVVSGGELRLLEIDPKPAGSNCCGSVLAGKALLQTTSSFSNASLLGSSVFVENGVANPGTSQAGRDLQAGILTFDGKGAVSVLSDENAAGSVRTGNAGAAVYSVDSFGRVTVQESTASSRAQGTGGGNNLPTFYLVGPNQAFGIDSSAGVGFYEVANQTAAASSGFTGSFGLGALWPSPTARIQTGAVSIASTGSATATLDVNQNGAISVAQSTTATLTAAANGRYLLTPAGKTMPQQAVYAVSPTTAYAIDISGSDSAPIMAFSSINNPVSGATK